MQRTVCFDDDGVVVVEWGDEMNGFKTQLLKSSLWKLQMVKDWVELVWFHEVAMILIKSRLFSAQTHSTFLSLSFDASNPGLDKEKEIIANSHCLTQSIPPRYHEERWKLAMKVEDMRSAEKKVPQSAHSRSMCLEVSYMRYTWLHFTVKLFICSLRAFLKWNMRVSERKGEGEKKRIKNLLKLDFLHILRFYIYILLFSGNFFSTNFWFLSTHCRHQTHQHHPKGSDMDDVIIGSVIIICAEWIISSSRARSVDE